METLISKANTRSWVFCVPVSLQILSYVIIALAVPQSTSAAEFNIPSGDVSALIASINMANSNNEDDTINLEAGTYTLTEVNNTSSLGANGLPSILSNVTINGSGADSTIIERDANAPDFRIFFVTGIGTLNINRLRISGGSGPDGGGVGNRGTVKIANSFISKNNTFFPGGGLSNRNVMTITNSTIAGNSADSGGGIYNGLSGTMLITNSAITDNNAIDTRGLSVLGGGISNFGSMTITNSTVSSNSSQERAGGILNWGGGLTITNVTISGNDAVTGGGIDNSLAGSVPLGTVELQNTILAANAASVGPDCRGEVSSLGNNLIGDPSDCSITLQDGDLTGEPGLAEFTDDGTPGNGHFPLLPVSAAIDGGNDDACRNTDQLENPRPIDGDSDGSAVCDIGAIEFQTEVSLTVNIDIKPTDKRNVINPRAKGDIWVAVLSDTDSATPFDPSSQVDIPTVEFGPAGARAIRHKVKDINKDGLGDLLLRFKISETGIACGDNEATLTGETFDGLSFVGTDFIKTVGCKPKKHYKRHHGERHERDHKKHGDGYDHDHEKDRD